MTAVVVFGVLRHCPGAAFQLDRVNWDEKKKFDAFARVGECMRLRQDVQTEQSEERERERIKASEMDSFSLLHLCVFPVATWTAYTHPLCLVVCK